MRVNKWINDRKPQKPQPKDFTVNKITHEMPFAQAVKANKTLVQSNDPSMVQRMPNMIDMLKIVMDKLDRLEARKHDTILQRTNQCTRST